MEPLDLQVLRDAAAWHAAGHGVCLVTVVQTWGSAPRPPGALLALRDDGAASGSVSGGCVEQDLIDRVRNVGLPERPSWLSYGVTPEEAARFGLPCGGTLRLLQEPLADRAWVGELLARTARHRLVRRTLHLATGQVTLAEGQRGDALAFTETTLQATFGPRWRLLLIGAGQLSRALGSMAQALDFEVLLCDPREEYRTALGDSGLVWLPGMPDDVVREIQPDAHTAIVALTHDPRLDDMALLEALKSQAFYVGALGSRRTSGARRERLRLFDLSDAEVARLHGPVGLPIGSRTPGEIAVSVLAEIVAVKNGAAVAV